MATVEQLKRALNGEVVETPRPRCPTYVKLNHHKVLDKAAERKRNKAQRKARRNSRK